MHESCDCHGNGVGVHVGIEFETQVWWEPADFFGDAKSRAITLLDCKSLQSR
jgi:hypothetical protein